MFAESPQVLANQFGTAISYLASTYAVSSFSDVAGAQHDSSFTWYLLYQVRACSVDAAHAYTPLIHTTHIHIRTTHSLTSTHPHRPSFALPSLCCCLSACARSPRPRPATPRPWWAANQPRGLPTLQAEMEKVDFGAELRALVSNRSFVLLTVSYGINVGCELCGFRIS